MFLLVDFSLLLLKTAENENRKKENKLKKIHGKSQLIFQKGTLCDKKRKNICENRLWGKIGQVNSFPVIMSFVCDC